MKKMTVFPHCDQRILHQPGNCLYCDRYPEWQALREAWGIAYTGQLPDIDGDIVMCPADYRRTAETYNLWSGNSVR